MLSTMALPLGWVERLGGREGALHSNNCLTGRLVNSNVSSYNSAIGQRSKNTGRNGVLRCSAHHFERSSAGARTKSKIWAALHMTCQLLNYCFAGSGHQDHIAGDSRPFRKLTEKPAGQTAADLVYLKYFDDKTDFSEKQVTPWQKRF